MSGNNTVFVGNIADAVSKGELYDFFNQRCGPVSDLNWRPARLGKCACAFVSFASVESLRLAMLLHESPLYGRPLNINLSKKSTSPPEQQQQQQQQPRQANHKIHVMPLEQWVGNRELIEAFSVLGQVCSIEWLQNEKRAGALLSFTRPLPETLDDAIRILGQLPFEALWKLWDE